MKKILLLCLIFFIASCSGNIENSNKNKSIYEKNVDNALILFNSSENMDKLISDINSKEEFENYLKVDKFSNYLNDSYNSKVKYSYFSNDLDEYFGNYEGYVSPVSYKRFLEIKEYVLKKTNIGRLCLKGWNFTPFGEKLNIKDLSNDGIMIQSLCNNYFIDKLDNYLKREDLEEFSKHELSKFERDDESSEILSSMNISNLKSLGREDNPILNNISLLCKEIGIEECLNKNGYYEDFLQLKVEKTKNCILEGKNCSLNSLIDSKEKFIKFQSNLLSYNENRLLYNYLKNKYISYLKGNETELKKVDEIFTGLTNSTYGEQLKNLCYISYNFNIKVEKLNEPLKSSCYSVYKSMIDSYNERKKIESFGN